MLHFPAVNVRHGRNLLLTALLACATAPDATPLEPESAIDGSFAVTHVAVVPMDGLRSLTDHTVVVRDGRIVAVAPAAGIEPAPDLPVVDGRGLYLMPGLIDMHVHISPGDLEAYVHHGVTTVRNM